MLLEINLMGYLKYSVMFCFILLRQVLLTELWLLWNLLCRPGWPWTRRDLPDTTSQMMALKGWATMPGLKLVIVINTTSLLTFTRSFLTGAEFLSLRKCPSERQVHGNLFTVSTLQRTKQRTFWLGSKSKTLTDWCPYLIFFLRFVI